MYVNLVKYILVFVFKICTYDKYIKKTCCIKISYWVSGACDMSSLALNEIECWQLFFLSNVQNLEKLYSKYK